MKTITIQLEDYKSTELPTSIIDIIKEQDDTILRTNTITKNNHMIMHGLVKSVFNHLVSDLNKSFEPLGLQCKGEFMSSSCMYFYLCSEGEFRENGIIFTVEVGSEYNNELDIFEYDTDVKVTCGSEFKYYDGDNAFGKEVFVNSKDLMEKYPSTFKKLYKLATKDLVM